jgi:hypothetical protein
MPIIEHFTKSKKGNSWEMVKLTFHDKKETIVINLNKNEGEWLVTILEKTSVYHSKVCTLLDIKNDFETHFEDFELFWQSKPIATIKNHDLLIL